MEQKKSRYEETFDYYSHWLEDQYYFRQFIVWSRQHTIVIFSVIMLSITFMVFFIKKDFTTSHRSQELSQEIIQLQSLIQKSQNQIKSLEKNYQELQKQHEKQKKALSLQGRIENSLDYWEKFINRPIVLQIDKTPPSGKIIVTQNDSKLLWELDVEEKDLAAKVKVFWNEEILVESEKMKGEIDIPPACDELEIESMLTDLSGNNTRLKEKWIVKK